MIILSMIKWVVLLPLHFLMIILCYILSPILPLFAIGKETLPSWLSWFQTPDAPLSGDEGFQHLYPSIKSTYLRRILWLQRNPAYGFAWSVLAAEVKPETLVFSVGKVLAKEGDWGAAYIWTEDNKYFQVRVFCPTVFGKCLKFRIGWKLKTLAVLGHGTDSKSKYVFTCNPFKSV